jgi:hypothetical protein
MEKLFLINVCILSQSLAQIRHERQKHYASGNVRFLKAGERPMLIFL